MNGARATVGWTVGGEGGVAKPTIVGLFTNISYGVTYDVQPAYILGRYTAAEIDYTAAEVVNITASGWRVVDSGWHKAGRLPRVQDLATAEYIELVVTDRQTGKRIAIIRNVRPTSVSGGFSARSLSESSHTFVGILVDDEEAEEGVTNFEGPGSPSFP